MTIICTQDDLIIIMNIDDNELIWNCHNKWFMKIIASYKWCWIITEYTSKESKYFSNSELNEILIKNENKTLFEMKNTIIDILLTTVVIIMSVNTSHIIAALATSFITFHTIAAITVINLITVTSVIVSHTTAAVTTSINMSDTITVITVSVITFNSINFDNATMHSSTFYINFNKFITLSKTLNNLNWEANVETLTLNWDDAFDNTLIK